MGFIFDALEAQGKKLASLWQGRDDFFSDESGLNPLHKAVLKDKSSVIKSLIKKGVSLEEPTLDEETPLHLAVKYGKQKAFALLIENGANLDAQDMHGKTALHLAIERGDLKMIDALTEAGADLEALTYGEVSPLLTAIWLQDEKVVEKLIQKGVDVNAVDDYNRIPLMEAVGEDNPLIVKMLLDAGADYQVKNEEGQGVMDMADNPEIIDVLTKSIPPLLLAGEMGAPDALRENGENITLPTQDKTNPVPAPTKQIS